LDWRVGNKVGLLVGEELGNSLEPKLGQKLGLQLGNWRLVMRDSLGLELGDELGRGVFVFGGMNGCLDWGLLLTNSGSHHQETNRAAHLALSLETSQEDSPPGGLSSLDDKLGKGTAWAKRWDSPWANDLDRGLEANSDSCC
jgi:hypothetical protein